MDANNIFRIQPTPAEEEKEKKEIPDGDGKDEVVDETNGEYLKPNWD